MRSKGNLQRSVVWVKYDWVFVLTLPYRYATKFRILGEWRALWATVETIMRMTGAIVVRLDLLDMSASGTSVVLVGLCGSGSFHVLFSDDGSEVTCPFCLDRVTEKDSVTG